MTEAELRATALQWLAAGRAAVVVEVAAARGSVPRGAGTRMLVAPDEVAGTIGGGHLELQAIAQARQRVCHPPAQAPGALQHVALGPSLGQCCGGALDLRYTPLQAADPAAWALPEPRFELQLHGAGHVGRALVRLLAGLPCTVHWVDEREAAFPPGPLPPHVHRVCTDPVEAEVEAAPPGAFYLVMTHSHDVDLRLSQAILRRGDFGWFGLIGSATKRARFEHRLLARGLPQTLVDRVVCPIGLPGIGGKQPEVIALAVAAQLMVAAGAGLTR